MRSFRSTIIFTLIVVVVLGYALFEMDRGKDDASTDAKKIRLFETKEQDLQELKIERPDGLLYLVRENDNWMLKQPVADRVDNFTATSYINSLLNQTAQVSDEKNQSWKEFGLETSQLSIEVTSKKGEKTRYEFGTEKAFDDSYFLRSGDKLLVGESSWDMLLFKNVRDIREKKLFHLGGFIKRMHIVNNLEKVDLTLVSRDGKWFYEPDDQLAINNDEVEKLAAEIANYRAVDFVAEEVSEKLLDHFNLTKPQVLIELWMDGAEGDGPHWWLKLSKAASGKEAFAYYKDRPTIYKVAGDSSARLTRNLNQLRDRKVPFNFQAEAVQELNLQTMVADIRLVKKGNQWSAAKATPGKVVDQEAVKSLLGKLTEMETRYYLGKKQGKGMGKEANRLVLKNSEGNSLLEFTWGDSFSVKKELKIESDEELYYATTNLSKELLGVSVGKVNELPGQTLFKPLTTEAPPIPGVEANKKE